jgi:hypothetical protein
METYIAENAGKFGAAEGSWSSKVKVFFNSGGDWNCGTMNNLGLCNAAPSCDAGDTLTLAGAWVMTSMVRINLFYGAWWDALNAAAGTIGIQAGNVS